MNAWRRWVESLENSRFREAVFQIHYWIGMVAAAYVFLMSVSGSAIVFRNQLQNKFSVGWIVNLHENLLLGAAGRFVNGIGALGLILLCLTGAIVWWPGMKNWRRSLTVNWSVHFPRINWDLHSAAGFWCFLFVLMWGVSGFYFVFPRPFDAFYVLDPADAHTTQSLYLLSELHFGRFGRFTEILWTLVGLVPAILAFTGFFICCRRVFFKKPSNPYVVSK